tara:strand:- start:258 stop:656 length:399 start_codon:yes stop_codon:yes gene_type:complete
MKKLTIDINELKASTQTAIEVADKRRQQKLAETKAKDERVARAAELKAEGIIAQIPNRCAKESEQGRTHAIVMSLTYEEQGKTTPPTHETIAGAAVHVWNACQEAELNPSLEYWHDGMGMKSGYNIVVHWND